MNLERIKVPVIFIICLILMLLGVLIWNKIIDNEKNKNNESDFIDVSDANNVANIDAQLGSDIRITTGYLLNYTTKKSSIWYMSQAYIVNIKNNKDTSIITLSSNKESKDYLEATIDTKNLNIKKGDNIYFVGNVSLSDNTIKLTKISKEPISYQDVEKIDFTKLYENISLLKKTTFTISGYMITDNDTYKIFDSKTTYQNNNTAGNYFTINWHDEFNLTGNDTVKITCTLADTYKLKDCLLK